MAFAFAWVNGAAAFYTETTLHDFCPSLACRDGKTPQFGLVADGSGNLYGTTDFGGKHGQGVAFKYVPSSGKLYVLHNFCSRTDCADGMQPEGSLIVDTAGNLYGTAIGGGKYNGGTLYELRPGSSGWTLKVLRDFCPDYDCTDSGGYPYGGLAYAGQASGAAWDPSNEPAYGVTWNGGANGFGGVFFACNARCLVLDRLIYSFKSSTEANTPLVGADHNIYGTTAIGGKYDGGLLYKLTSSGSNTWSESVLHNFCKNANCADGKTPSGRLAMDAQGDLFGVTYEGGAYPCEGKGCGVIFERASDGTYTVRHNFCSQPNCTDGAHPRGGPVLDSYGNLFGTVTLGGSMNLGAAYEFVPGTGAQTLRYNFCTTSDCTDGFDPQSELLLYGGEFYGTTHDGGTHQGGAVFSLMP